MTPPAIRLQSFDYLFWPKNPEAGALVERLMQDYKLAIAGNDSAFTRLKQCAEVSISAKYALACFLFEKDAAGQVSRIYELLRDVREAFVPAKIQIAHLMELGLIQGSVAEIYENYLAAAEAGFVPAVDALAHKLYSGQFGLDRRNECVKWLLLASQSDCSGADALLGMAYLNGDMVERDLVAAKRHLNRAADRGEEMAKLALASDPRLAN